MAGVPLNVASTILHIHICSKWPFAVIASWLFKRFLSSARSLFTVNILSMLWPITLDYITNTAQLKPIHSISHTPHTQCYNDVIIKIPLISQPECPLNSSTSWLTHRAWISDSHTLWSMLGFFSRHQSQRGAQDKLTSKLSPKWTWQPADIGWWHFKKALPLKQSLNFSNIIIINGENIFNTGLPVILRCWIGKQQLKVEFIGIEKWLWLWNKEITMLFLSDRQWRFTEVLAIPNTLAFLPVSGNVVTAEWWEAFYPV